MSRCAGRRDIAKKQNPLLAENTYHARTPNGPGATTPLPECSHGNETPCACALARSPPAACWARLRPLVRSATLALAHSLACAVCALKGLLECLRWAVPFMLRAAVLLPFLRGYVASAQPVARLHRLSATWPPGRYHDRTCRLADDDFQDTPAISWAACDRTAPLRLSSNADKGSVPINNHRAGFPFGRFAYK